VPKEDERFVREIAEIRSQRISMHQTVPAVSTGPDAAQSILDRFLVLEGEELARGGGQGEGGGELGGDNPSKRQQSRAAASAQTKCKPGWRRGFLAKEGDWRRRGTSLLHPATVPLPVPLPHHSREVRIQVEVKVSPTHPALHLLFQEIMSLEQHLTLGTCTCIKSPRAQAQVKDRWHSREELSRGEDGEVRFMYCKKYARCVNLMQQQKIVLSA
jgi:hypothetical protein